MDKEAFNEKTQSWYDILRVVFILMLIAVLTLSVVKYVWQTIRIDGDSMLPTFVNGDKILISKIGRRSAYDRYDVIVFKPYDKDDPETPEDESSMLYIKRIVGLPGETIRVSESGYIELMNETGSFERLDDDVYGNSSLTRGINWNLYDSDFFETITLADDEYFVLGDNRSISLDSRSSQIRAVNMNCILGKYVIGIRPFGKK